MQIGVFTVLFQHLPFEKALDKAVAAGVSAVEIGTGGYPGNHHCPLNELLRNETERRNYLKALSSRNLFISALSCQYEPLHPDREIGEASNQLLRKTVQLASLLGVPVVNVLSGAAPGSAYDRSLCWITCPWPPYFLEMLNYQWNQVAIPYWREAAAFAADYGVKLACEMHPGMVVYNVESFLKMREAAGPHFCCNFDPSHLFWNGADPVAAIRKLGEAIVHVHGKDCYVDPFNVALNGCNDNKAYHQIAGRAWTFRSIGYGHEAKVWKDIVSALRLIGYDYVISIEHEDALMSSDEGLSKGVALLKEVMMTEKPGRAFWE